MYIHTLPLFPIQAVNRIKWFVPLLWFNNQILSRRSPRWEQVQLTQKTVSITTCFMFICHSKPELAKKLHKKNEQSMKERDWGSREHESTELFSPINDKGSFLKVFHFSEKYQYCIQIQGKSVKPPGIHSSSLSYYSGLYLMLHNDSKLCQLHTFLIRAYFNISSLSTMGLTFRIINLL